jgi:hypothetical protein
VSVKHHFLRFAGVGAKVGLAAVREAKVGDFHHLRHCTQNDLFMTPVELAGLTRGKYQGDKGIPARRTLRLPLLYKTLDAVVGPCIALSLQIFK